MVIGKGSTQGGPKVTHRNSRYGFHVAYLLSCVVLAAWITPLLADEENDFDFVDRQHVENGGVVSYGTLLDDEDLINDQGSGPEEREEYSGTVEIVTGVHLSSARPVFPYTTTPVEERHDIDYYRSVINFTSLIYSHALNSTSSADYQHHASAIKMAVERIFQILPGQQTANVVQFRPGSYLYGGQLSSLATVDLTTSGYYDRFTLFNALNNAVNQGVLGSYHVNPTGFEFRPHSRNDTELLCPSTIGRPPTSMPRLGDTQANLMLGNRFLCKDWLEGIEYFRGSPDGSVFVGVWEHLGTLDYILKARVELPPAPIGIHRVRFPPVEVKSGQFLGVHYSADASSGVIGYAIPEDSVIPSDEMYQVLIVNVHDESMTPQQSLHLSGEKEFAKKAFALQGFLRSGRGKDDDVFEPKASTLSPPRPKPTCAPHTQFQCYNGACIDIRRKCDAHFDCTDRSDEYNCPTASTTCSSLEFQCHNGECVDSRRVCDGRIDCQDGSDEEEQNCPVKTCEWWQFTCHNGDCIHKDLVCNGYSDCLDRSDEYDCSQFLTTTLKPTTTEAFHACYPSQFRCTDGRCIAESQRCDGRVDCSEEEDEDVEYCEFCPDLEPPAGSLMHREGNRVLITCSTSTETWQLYCIRRKWVGELGNCTQRDGLPRICSSADFQCKDGTCIPAEAHCNRRYDCNDYSDEVNCIYTLAPPVQCSLDQFRCDDGSCIQRDRQCDNNYDCRDRSDERDCYTLPPSRICAQWQFRCGDGNCIDRELQCNRRYDCQDRSDESDCETPSPPPRACSSWQYRCADGTCIDNRLRCDHRYDCPDGTDETVDCEAISVSASPGEMRIREGMTATFVCRPQGTPPPRVTWSRDGQRLPPQAVDDLNGRLTIPEARLDDSGRYICSTVGTRVPYEAKVTLHVDRVYGPTQVPPGPRQCYDVREFMCNNRACIPTDYRCDGDYDCTDHSDEANCLNETVSCEPNEFKCTTNNKCVLKIWLCDGDDDCGGDGSDERSCAAFSSTDCRFDEFQCRTGGQCVPAGYQCDGERDCLDSSDESGCSRPTAVKIPPREITVQQGDPFEIECEAIGIPPPLIVWRLNWGHVGQPPRVNTTSERITNSRDGSVVGRGVIIVKSARKEDEGAYTCEALNTMGSVFIEPDTIVHVLPRSGVCPRGYFNADARTQSECIHCFCFGLAHDCTSSSLFLSEISIGNNVEILDRFSHQPLASPVFRYDPRRLEFVIHDYSRTVRGSGFYWSLPQHFLGNKVTSYGGKLTYSVSYTVPHGRQSYLEPGPDVVLSGNGITLYHNVFVQPFAGAQQTATVSLTENFWFLDEQGRTKATRENIMTALQKLDYILIKSNYDRGQEEARLSRVSITVTTQQRTTLGRAFLVEQCTCPIGYTGPSCEQCSPGFHLTEERGQYIRKCSGCNCHGHSNECDERTGLCKNCQHNTEGDRCERCRPGFYGDPRLGTPQDCRPCPCPPPDGPELRKPSECHVDHDGEVSCHGCPRPGYLGRKCERCAPGYQSHPGGVCRKIDGEHCDPRGSVSATPFPPTGQCICKQFATGPSCSQCREDAFYPAEVNPYGCVACFCMGVTRSCTSTTWNRAQVMANFRSDAQGFVLTNRDRSEIISSGIIADPQKQEIKYRTFHNLRGREYYWSLPDKFLRNKLTSYGGNLRFTILHLPGLNASPTRYPDVEISGNDIVLEYVNSRTIQPNQPMEITVPLYENYWRRADGTSAPREHLMMALADLDFIMIKAKYTEDVAESSLRSVSLDVAENRNTGLERAYAVEECVCPPGYRGLSCEVCDSGYRRSGGGLYLGTCEPCDCFGHASECDTSTGTCKNCQHNTAGDRCDECAPGFYGDATRGHPNDCQPCPCPLSSSPNQFSRECYLDNDGQVTCSACPPGHIGRQCERCAPGYSGDPFTPGDYCRRTNGLPYDCRCDTRGVVPNTRCDSRTRQCICKVYATGLNCDQCKPGYFNLDQSNPNGCLSCHCMGATRQCTSSRYYTSQITPVFQADGSHNFALTTNRLSQQITDGFRVNAPANEISFERFSEVQRPRESLYWNLPPRFRGSKVTSYGGLLKFLLSYSTSGFRGQSYQDTDVELISGDQRLFTYFRSYSEAPTLHEIRLVESTFRQIDGATPTRETFLKVLANLDAILIRATYHTSMVRSTLRDLSLDTAVSYNTGQGIANMVEDCTCPPGYTGLSCETCASGYSHVDTPDNPFGSCVACNCHGHSTSCDPSTGACRDCQHNTVGDHCDRCAPGYYGNPRSGTLHDCRPCPCPLTIPENQFSRTCYLDSDGSPTCDQCATGYSGRQCDQCAAGYTGSPRQPGGACTEESEDNRPKITISPMRLSTSVGGSITFQCDVRGRGPFNIQWIRADGRPLPTDRSVVGRDNSLRITNLQPSDSGRYICVAVNAFGRSQLDAELAVQGDQHLKVIVNEPKQQTTAEGTSVQFHCIGMSPNVYTLAWTRKDGRPMDSRIVDDGQGTLIIRSVRREDQGAYLCTGSDIYDVATDEAYLSIRGGDEAPVARIEPNYVTASTGESVQLRCVATGYPAPRIEWSGGPSGRLPADVTTENDILRFQSVTSHHAGEYHCTATNRAGVATVRAVLNVEDEVPGFEVVIDEPELRVRPGDDAKVDCVAKSHVKVEAIEWTKHGDRLPPGAYQIGGQLVIPECRPEYSGRYVCTIYLVNGDRKVAYSSISIVDDGFTEVPRVTLDPVHHVVNEGSTSDIRCLATGNPTPSITWSRSRGQLGRNHQVFGNVLRILDATSGDSDSYICEARNSAGVARGTAVVQVERQEYPAVEIYPTDVIDVKVGQNAMFQCLATDRLPAPTITWRRANNEPFTPNTEVTEGSGAIQFFQVTGAEAGSYICTAVSSGRTVSATARLRIQGVPRITIRPSNVLRLVEGQRLFAECVVEGAPGAQIYWQTPFNSIIRGTDGSAILDISSASSRDSGTYRCIAQSATGQVEGSLQVTVTGFDGRWTTLSPDGQRISAAVQPQQIRVALGQTAEFRCSATGSPPPHLHWTKVDGSMPDTHYVRDGILRIDRVSESDSGTYKCIARSQYGSGEVTVQLHVLVPPKIVITPTMQTLRPGDLFQIQCTARGTEPIVVEWSKLFGSLSPNARDYQGVLEIASVTSSDAGRYKCTASNDAGRAESLAELIILAPPGAIVSPKSIHMGAGQTVQFNCEVTGAPHPRIHWLKPGGNLPEQHSVEGGTLTLFNIQPHDDGLYVCMVTNEVGTTRDSGQLKVIGRDDQHQVHDKRETLTVGDQVEINCEVTGEPRPTVKWIKVNSHMSPHVILRDTHLIIPSITKEDEGTYRCVASSVTGTVYAQVTLLVVAPPNIPVSRQSRTVSTGGRAVLTCRVFGDPKPSVHWSKTGGLLPRDHETNNGVLVIPAVRPEDFGEYICTATNQHGSAEGIITLESGELVPYFAQNPVSYMSYPTIKDAYKTFDIDISFKPQSAEGLILYNGQLDDGTGDFISFGLRNRRAELRLDVGSGPAIITTDPVELDSWHTITIKRDGKDASLFLNGREYKGQAPGSFVGLDLTENMYLGAVPDFRRISRLADFTRGFVGCISRIVVSGEPINLGGEVLDNNGITDCPVCQYRPCFNGGTCRAARTEFGFECFCPRNYSGVNCELVGERCVAGICGQRGICTNLKEGTGYRCSCPLGVTGLRCEQGSTVSTPSFDSSSYIEYPTISNALFDVNLKLTFLADSPNNALLLYNGFSRYGDGDFIALSIRDGYVHFQYDTGTGAADIQSREPVKTGEWITVVAERSRQDGSLSINNGIAVKGISPEPDRGTSLGDTIGLNLKTSLFIGGISDVRMSPATGFLAGFVGCISEVRINDVPLGLVNEAISFRHVSECRQRHGHLCASVTCENGGTCLENRDSFSCVCSLGFQGRFCQTRTTIETNVQFDGNGFIELPHELLLHDSPLSVETSEFSVTTHEANALLFWHGQPPATLGRGKDYMSVAIENGHVVFSFELGSGPANIISQEVINDGATHQIKVERTGKQGTLEVDGFPRYKGESGGEMTGLNVNGNIYLGGLPDYHTMTGGKYSQGLVGCISDVYFDTEEPLDFSREAVTGVGVQPCSPSSS